MAAFLESLSASVDEMPDSSTPANVIVPID
jgi:hypothetical protein